MAGLPHEFPDGSEQLRFARFQNRKQDQGSKMKRSATVADQVVLKRSGACMSAKRTFSNHGRSSGSQTTPPMERALGLVQQPWQTRRFSNLLSRVEAIAPFSNRGRICRLNWAFLFQRTAKSARSSCFCDPPSHFSIRLSDLRKHIFPP